MVRFAAWVCRAENVPLLLLYSPWSWQSIACSSDKEGARHTSHRTRENREWPATKMRPFLAKLHYCRPPASLCQESFGVIHTRDPGYSLFCQGLDPGMRFSRG